MSNTTASFPSPFSITPPAGAHGWEEMYPYYLVFDKRMRDDQESKFWFCDSQHWPKPFKPFDCIGVEFAVKGLSQYNTRHLLVPPANGLEAKILNGYLYMSPVPVAPEDIPGRVPHFLERAGHYYQNWDSLLDNWKRKVRGVIDEMEALDFSPLPDVVPVEDVKSGLGKDQTTKFLDNYDRAIQLVHDAWQYHFEFLNLGYAAYLDFFMFCKQNFPNIPDLAVARMVQGIDVELFRPDDELKRLARLAVDLGVDSALETGSVADALAAVGKHPNGAKWLAAWQGAQQPWFNFTTGNGFYSADKYWIEHLDIPLGFVRDYIRRVKKGETIERPTEALIAERNRISTEYAELLDGEARQAFEGKLGLARVVFPYVENHNFYIEHWFMGAFWRKMRELSKTLQGAGFWTDPDDMFYLTRNELRDVLFDYVMGWASGAGPVGHRGLSDRIAARRKIVDALSSALPQPALNQPPDVITEPFTIMLWGITSETVNSWLKEPTSSDKLTGLAASPGTAEGVARIVRSEADLEDVEDGDILVATVTAPSWAPVFGKIRAAVTDIGGMMSHAAIVCREYGLPAVTATGTATKSIRAGQRVRVDGGTGEVVILG
jgi:pyruvate, water dikinase